MTRKEIITAFKWVKQSKTNKKALLVAIINISDCAKHPDVIGQTVNKCNFTIGDEERFNLLTELVAEGQIAFDGYKDVVLNGEVIGQDPYYTKLKVR